MEGVRDRRGVRLRLSATDRQCEFTFRHNGLAGFVHDAQVARLQFEVDFLRSARLQVHALKGTQCFSRRSRKLRKAEIELHDFIPGDLALVGDGRLCDQRLAGV